MTLVLSLLAAAAVMDGGAAKEHASKLAALGPHPFGSPRSRFAAEYVATQFREVGLEEVRLQDVDARDARGTNVVAVLRAPGAEFIVLAAHHDTVQESPGAYGSGGGVGVLIEAARALARSRDRARTVVFASFDGREPVLDGRGGLGARAFVQSLGREARPLVGALILDRAGRRGIGPVLETVAYPDPLRPGSTLVAPASLVRAAVLGTRTAGISVAAGDPAWSWLYQAGVRTFRVADAGDDRPFLEGGLPALRISGRRFLAADPKDLLSADTGEHLDADALAATGRALLGVVAVLQSSGKPGAAETDWFLRFGQVAGRNALLITGLVSLVPGLLLGLKGGRFRLTLWLVQALVFGVLLYRQPVFAVFVFFLWNVLTAFGPRLLGLALGALPAMALVLFGALGFTRGLVNGVHLTVFDVVLALAAASLALVSGRSRAGRKKGGGGRRGR
jgi:Peptidase family M28